MRFADIYAGYEAGTIGQGSAIRMILSALVEQERIRESVPVRSPYENLPEPFDKMTARVRKEHHDAQTMLNPPRGGFADEPVEPAWGNAKPVRSPNVTPPPDYRAELVRSPEPAGPTLAEQIERNTREYWRDRRGVDEPEPVGPTLNEQVGFLYARMGDAGLFSRPDQVKMFAACIASLERLAREQDDGR